MILCELLALPHAKHGNRSSLRDFRVRPSPKAADQRGKSTFKKVPVPLHRIRAASIQNLIESHSFCNECLQSLNGEYEFRVVFCRFI